MCFKKTLYYFSIIITFTIFSFTSPTHGVIKDIKSLTAKVTANKVLTAAELSGLEKAITDAKAKCTQSKKSFDDHQTIVTLQQSKDLEAKTQLSDKRLSLQAVLQRNNQELLLAQQKLQDNQQKNSDLSAQEKELNKSLIKAKDDLSKTKDKKKASQFKKEIEDIEKKIDLSKRNKIKLETEQIKLKDDIKSQNTFISSTERQVEQLTRELTVLEEHIAKPDAALSRLKLEHENDTAKLLKLETTLLKAKNIIALSASKKQEATEKALKEAAAKAKVIAELDEKKRAFEDQARIEAETTAKLIQEAKKKAKDEKARKAKLKRKQRRKEKRARRKAAAKAKLLKLQTLQKTMIINNQPANEEDDKDDLLSLCSESSDHTEDTDDSDDESESQFEEPNSDTARLTPGASASSSSAPLPPPMPKAGFCTPRAAKFKVVKRTNGQMKALSPKKGFKQALIDEQIKRGIYQPQTVELPSTAKVQPGTTATNSTQDTPLVTHSDCDEVVNAAPPPPPPLPVGGIKAFKCKIKTEIPTATVIPLTPRGQLKPVQLKVSLDTIKTARSNLRKKDTAQQHVEPSTMLPLDVSGEATLSTVNDDIFCDVEPIQPPQPVDLQTKQSNDDDDGPFTDEPTPSAPIAPVTPQVNPDEEAKAIAKLAAIAKAEEEFEERLKKLPGYTSTPGEDPDRAHIRHSLSVRRTSFIFSDDSGADTGGRSLNDSFFGTSSHVDTAQNPTSLTPAERIENEIVEKTKQSDSLITEYVKKETEVLNTIKYKLAIFFNIDASTFPSFESLFKANIIVGKDFNLSESLSSGDIITGWEHFRKVTGAKQTYQKSEAEKKAKECAFKFAKRPNPNPVQNCLLPWGRRVLSALEPNLLTDNLVRECQNVRKELHTTLTKTKTLVKEIYDLKEATSTIQNRLAELMCWKEQIAAGERLSDEALKSLGFAIMPSLNILDALKDKF